MSNTTTTEPTRKFKVFEHSHRPLMERLAQSGGRQGPHFVLTLIRETKTTLVMAYPSATNPERTVTFNKRTKALKTDRRARPSISVIGWARLQWICEVYA